MDTTPQDPKLLGDWPDVDLIVLQDYKHSAAAQPTRHEPECFLRVHMDIEIKNRNDLRDLIELIEEGGKEEEVFKMVERVAGQKPGTRGRALLIAALGLDPDHESEPMPEPSPVPKPSPV